jgi:acylphosphatase
VKLIKLLRIHGRVQGVGYRYSMMEQAEQLGLTGWVRNRRDGTVEAVVVGDDEAIAKIIEWARQGPPGASISNVQVSDTSGSYSGFELRPTE